MCPYELHYFIAFYLFLISSPPRAMCGCGWGPALTVRAEKAQTNMTISDSRKESQTEIESN